MSDFLVDLGENDFARKTVKSLGLPIPLPQKLDRSSAPWEELPLQNAEALVCHTGGTKFTDLIASTLSHAGAGINEVSDKTPENLKPKFLIYDASGLKTPADLKGLYEFFHAWVRKLEANGRAVILAHPPESMKTPAEAACAQAVNGFTRSMAREIGKKGATAQTLYIDQSATKAAEPLLRFILSNRSAYISAQPIHVDNQIAVAAKVPYVSPLSGKIALVTGAARGIGAEVARALAREGAKVVGLDRPGEEEPLKQLMDQLGGEYILGDIMGNDAPKKIHDEIKQRFKSLDIVIHNAGVTRDKMLANMDDARWDMTLGVNLIALINLNEKLLGLLKKNGRIICMASIAGIAGNMGQTNYSASKAGVIGYVRSLAPSLVEKGITINAVAPGFIETQMTAAIPFATREVARRLCNLSQGGLPEDIAELVTFLASPGAAGTTGEVIRICGGNYVGA
jgi:3-oxoacyl-[acyl-carrier protein] reductase